MTLFRWPACPPRAGNLRAAGIGYLCSGAAFLCVAWFAGQVAFTGVGFAFVGLGLSFIANARRSGQTRNH